MKPLHEHWRHSDVRTGEIFVTNFTESELARWKNGELTFKDWPFRVQKGSENIAKRAQPNLFACFISASEAAKLGYACIAADAEKNVFKRSQK